jgi:hypothetical protein
VNPETGGLEGCFFAFIYDIPDPNGDLHAETLDSFGNVDAFAACRAVEPQTPTSPGQTRAGLLVPMGAIPPKLTADIDIWRRHWVRLDECRVVNFFFTPKNRYRPRKLQPREFPPGIWQTPGHYNISPRQVVGPYSEFAAILTNEPLPIHPQGTRVWTALDRAGNTDLVVSQPLRHWALFKRPHNELLPRGLQLVKEEEPPACTILYAMTMYNETHPDAFKTGQFGGGTGGGTDGDGDDKKRKGKPPPTPSRDTSHSAKTGTTTPSKPPGSKRKAPKGRAKDTSGPRGSQRPKPATPVLKKQEVGTTASAIIPGVDAEGSASRKEWHSVLRAAISGPGSNFLRLQQLIGQLQTALSPGQPAQALLVLDFLKLQDLVAEWVDPAPAQLVPPANYKLLKLCGSVLLPMAIRMSVEATRVIIALINALLYGVSDIVGTIETSMRGPRDRDRDDDGRGPRGHTERRTGEASRPARTEQRERRDDRRDDGGR